MKFKHTFILATMTFLVSGCALLPFGNKANNNSSTSQNSLSNTNTETSTNTGTTTNTGIPSSTSGSSGPTKVTVPAHTLSDTNPPIDVDSDGQEVSASTWNSFRNGSQSKFNGNYNYTYRAYSGGNLTVEKYTKNGYYASSTSGTLRYERKSGTTFYQYISVSDGYLRQETTLDLQTKYTYRIWHEISVHMFDMVEYEYYIDGTYVSNKYGYTSQVKFQGGYLTLLRYILDGNVFEIYVSFETTIDIPQSYYYQ